MQKAVMQESATDDNPATRPEEEGGGKRQGEGARQRMSMRAPFLM